MSEKQTILEQNRRTRLKTKMGVVFEDTREAYLRSSCGSTQELHLEESDYRSQQSEEEETKESIERGMMVGPDNNNNNNNGSFGDYYVNYDVCSNNQLPPFHEEEEESPLDNGVVGENDDDDEAPSSPLVEEETANKLFMGPYTRHEYIFAICAGSVLAFNSGYVNGSCLSGFIAPSGRQQAAASLTSTMSRSAMAFADGNYSDFAFMIGMVLSFMMGSFISGFMTPKPTKFRIEPTYGPTFLLGAIFLVISSTLAALESREDLVFFLAAAANGIQNGISSSYSGNLIRSTGYTGAITDICIVLAQMSQGNSENAWKLGVLTTLLVSFWLGGIVSYWSALHLTHLSLLINAGIFVLIGGSLVAFLVIELGISIQEAVLGTWNWQKAIDKLHSAFLDTSIFFCRADDPIHPSQQKQQRLQGGGGGSCLDESANASTRGELTDRQLNGIFSRLDTDHSNTLDEGKLYIALRNAGMVVSKRECQIMMSHASLSGDGTITRAEWIQIVRSTRQKRMSDFSIFSSKGSMRSMRIG